MASGLYTVRVGKNSPYCGPYALAAVTGVTYAEACRKLKALRRENRKHNVPKRIKAMWNEEMSALLGPGWVAVSGPRRTLGQFIKQNPTGTFVVQVTGHYLVLSDGYFIDNQTRRRRMAKNAPRQRRMVKTFWGRLP